MALREGQVEMFDRMVVVKNVSVVDAYYPQFELRTNGQVHDLATVGAELTWPDWSRLGEFDQY